MEACSQVQFPSDFKMMSDGQDKLSEALCHAQGELTIIKKDADNPHKRSRYASLAAIMHHIRAPLARHGLSVEQGVVPVPFDPKIYTYTRLRHESGQFTTSVIPVLPGEIVKGGGYRESHAPQPVGIAITYGHRYGLKAIGVFVEHDDPMDNDGELQTVDAPPKAPAKTRPKDVPLTVVGGVIAVPQGGHEGKKIGEVPDAFLERLLNSPHKSDRVAAKGEIERRLEGMGSAGELPASLAKAAAAVAEAFDGKVVAA